MKQLVILGCHTLLLISLLSSSLSAQELTVSIGDDVSFSSGTIQLIALVTLLSLAPGIIIMITCFPFIVTVLSILRQGIGLQSAPPNMLIVSLALFLTYYVMNPVFLQAWEVGILPLLDEEISASTAWQNTMDPFRTFMLSRVDLDTLSVLQDLRTTSTSTGSQPDLSELIPAFLLSEIERAFEIGFLIFLPFLIIDLVIAAILMSMGMMMVPPALVSLPFKLAFFVVADGWLLISEALVRGYV